MTGVQTCALPISRLIADDEKAGRADFSYVNDGTRQQLDDFVAETMRALAARQPA